jgi:flagellar basal-body rod protein FlgG
MLPALWVAKTGLSAQDTNLTTISNNLANVSTTGFKRDRAEFQDLLYQIKRQPGAQSTQDSELPSGLQLGTGVRIVGTQKNFTAGSLQTTEQPLDMAIDGRGFFQILQPDGTTSYTRDGTFHLTPTARSSTPAVSPWSRPSSCRTTPRPSPSAATAPCRSPLPATRPPR